MHRNLQAAVAALACALISAPALAQSTVDKIKQAGAITIGHRDASIPFSYYDDQQRVVGYTMEICMRIVDDLKKDLNMPNIQVNYQLATSANRIPLMANGTIDLECGSTTNNLERQKQVSFTNTHFVTANRWVAKKSSKLKTLADLKGKTIVSTAGSTNIKQITEINAAQNLGMNIISANGHPEAFQMVETGRAVAFVMDDIILAGLAAQSRSPADYEISSVALSVEPYGIMLRKDDKAFKAVADKAMTDVYKSGQINAIYTKWFEKPVPPKGINMNLPMTEVFRNVPVIVQMFLWFFVAPEVLPKGLGDWVKQMPPPWGSYLPAVMCRGLYPSVRIAEQVKSGIGSLSRGQGMAGTALGLTLGE